MRIAVFGAKAEAVYLMDQIEQNSFLTGVCFVDNNSQLWGTHLHSKKVVSFSQLINYYPENIDAVIVAVRGSHSRASIIYQLLEKGISKIGLFKFSYYDYQKKVFFNEIYESDSVVWLDKINKPVLPYLETNVMDSCNLNCKGCTHFSNLFEENSRVEYKQFLNDLTQVAKKSFVVQLRLLGGEPLLNTQLYKFVEASRKILPRADIEVVTNALLIPKQDALLFKIMRSNDVGFLISKYKPTMRNKSVIEEILKKHQVDYYFERDIIYEFGRTLSMKGNSNTDLSQQACISRGCRFLRNGRLYKCPFEGLIDKFAEVYGYDKILEEERGFDIYDENIDWGDRIKQYFDLPVPMCKYCSEKCEMFQWEVKGNPAKEDWLVKN